MGTNARTEGAVWAIGLMSGTSMDGIDVALIDTDGDRELRPGPAASYAYPPEIKVKLRSALAEAKGLAARELRPGSLGEMERVLTELNADAVDRFLRANGVDKGNVDIIGYHGQTVLHDAPRRLTVQLGDGRLLADRTGVDVVFDLRAADVAAGGQGAPLVPAFHAALFGRRDLHRVIVNVGGIANITDLPRSGVVHGFDTGPGNVLSDLWCARNRGTTFDAHGAWAGTGKPNPARLDTLLAEPFFAAPPPKSTHRDKFNLQWLEERLAAAKIDDEAENIQATLVALTARTIGDAIRAYAPDADEVLVCGGGANNATLMRALASETAPRKLATTAEEGVAIEQVEALAFAWLAREALAGRPGNLPEVTGAKGRRILGAIYPR